MRAATRLEALHNGFPALLAKISQLDTTTLRNVISYAATDQDAAQAVLRSMAGSSLQGIQQACLGPVYALVMALTLTGSDDEPASESTKPVAWADLYADLFKSATGRLGWAPQDAWNATLPEILLALEGHADWMNVLHGSAEEDQDGPSDEQRQQNEAQGLDPEFDRSGLMALRELSGMRVGMTA
ncbi:hypothetical protein [Phaeobacter inhibens]|uniref:hypothetical protein n=1 Tax=Phaeobacter inhibens TaxID=221822 RepID=UPI000CA1BD85|nr:hypothetical protein [Phaeobacter inhibens]AUQ62855.1 hypothetical protein PhaeoP51_01870 [Phaeobacter inhibens]AUQ82759.1 hypothetical protein PhaeoP57_01829 [Phaeobacter inhibens]AUQ90520.1 hypothetical protein PhaeoP24_01903 [Phaeobacter inhibens]MDO6754716.1 hypothetical protein [Phaeobacter inhibens]